RLPLPGVCVRPLPLDACVRLPPLPCACALLLRRRDGQPPPPPCAYALPPRRQDARLPLPGVAAHPPLPPFGGVPLLRRPDLRLPPPPCACVPLPRQLGAPVPRRFGVLPLRP